MRRGPGESEFSPALVSLESIEDRLTAICDVRVSRIEDRYKSLGDERSCGLSWLPWRRRTRRCMPPQSDSFVVERVALRGSRDDV